MPCRSEESLILNEAVSASFTSKNSMKYLFTGEFSNLNSIYSSLFVLDAYFADFYIS